MRKLPELAVGSLGFCFYPLCSSAFWEFWYDLLEEFKAREGNCRVLQGHKEDDFKLGSWVRTQRRNKETLTPERKQRLDALGFVWEVR